MIVYVLLLLLSANHLFSVSCDYGYSAQKLSCSSVYLRTKDQDNYARHNPLRDYANANDYQTSAQRLKALQQEEMARIKHVNDLNIKILQNRLENQCIQLATTWSSAAAQASNALRQSIPMLKKNQGIIQCDQFKQLISLAHLQQPNGRMHELLCNTIDTLMPILLDENGQFKIVLSARDIAKALAIIQHYEESFSRWFNTDGMTECKEKVLEIKEWGGSYESLVSKSYYYGFDYLKNKYPAYTDIIAVEKLCSQREFKSAYALTRKYSHIQSANVHEMIYFDHFNTHYNHQGIDRRYLEDPFIKTLGTLPYSPIPSNYNEQLAARHKDFLFIQQKCLLQDANTYQKAIIYRGVDFQQEKNPLECIQYFGSLLSNPNSDRNLKNAALTLCNAQYLPRWIQYNSTVNKAVFPKNLIEPFHTQDYKLVGSLALLPEGKNNEPLERAIRYINQSCKDNQYSSAHHIHAQSITNALYAQADKKILQLPDYSITHSDRAIEHYRLDLVEHASKYVIKTPDQILSSQEITILNKLGEKYESLKNFDPQAQTFFKNAQLCNYDAQYILNDTRGATRRELTSDSISLKYEDELSERSFSQAFAAQSMRQEGERMSRRAYPLSGLARSYLIEQGKDYASFEHLYGNQMQHALHDGFTRDLNTTGHLHYQNLKPGLRAMLELGAQSNFLCHSYIKVRDYFGAINSSTLAYRALTFVKDALEYRDYLIKEVAAGAIEGAAAGVFNTAQICYGAVRRPFQTSKHLATSLAEVCSSINQLQSWGEKTAALMIFDPQKAQPEVEKLKTVSTAIAKNLYTGLKDGGARGASKAISQFVTEIHCFNQVGKVVCMGAKAVKMNLSLLKNGQLSSTVNKLVADAAKTFSQLPKAEEAIAVTAEGIEIKAGQAAENCTFQESKEFIPRANASISPSQEITIDEKFLKMFENININEFNTEILSEEKLISAIEYFKNTKGALTKDGPLNKVLNFGKKGMLEHEGMARGAAFEVETALIKRHKGEEILEFGCKKALFKKGTQIVEKILEIDMVTATKLVESKGYRWHLIPPQDVSKKVADIKNCLIRLHRLAQQESKILEFFTRKGMPDSLKEFLIEQQITFFEI